MHLLTILSAGSQTLTSPFSTAPHGDGTLADSVLRGQGSLCLTNIISSNDTSDFRVCDGGFVIPHPTGSTTSDLLSVDGSPGLPPLSDFVSHVLPRSTEEEMAGVAARFIVTSVTHQESVGDGPKGQDIGQSVSSPTNTTNLDGAIPIHLVGPVELPAQIRTQTEGPAPQTFPSNLHSRILPQEQS